MGSLPMAVRRLFKISTSAISNTSAGSWKRGERELDGKDSMAVEQSQGAVELVLDTLNSELMSYINKGEAYEQTAVAREYLVSG